MENNEDKLLDEQINKIINDDSSNNFSNNETNNISHTDIDTVSDDINNSNENSTFHTDINMVSDNTNNINPSLTNEIEKNKINTINNSNKNENIKEALQGVKKTRFKYQVINSQGKKVNGYIDAYNKDEVSVYLSNEGYEVLKLDVSKDIELGVTRLSYGELSFTLTQLSTYLKAGISLIDSVRILERQSVKANQRRIFSNIGYELVKGESFSSALAAQGNVFPKLFINMTKTAEMTGDLPSVLDDMAEYYTTIDKTRKQTVSAMAYPTIIFVFSIAVITFILTYVIPTFTQMFSSNNAKLPNITLKVIEISNFLRTKGLILIGIIIGILVIYTLAFKFIKPFRKAMQSFYMRLPVVKNLVIYKEVAMFTKTFASLLNHDVFITDTMEILSNITTNEVYSDIIKESLDNLAKGARISDAFKGKWAFPIVAYEMLVTGENTGKLPTMMSHVAAYYEDLYANYVKRLNTFIEPVMIILLAAIVGTVILSVIIPMLSFNSQVL